MTQARVLYDFEAQAEFGEINLKVGEIVSVISENAGEGWWRGTNVNGEQGLFPKDFVEKFDPNEDATTASSSLRPPNEKNKNLHYRDSCWVWPDENQSAGQNSGVNINVFSDSDEDESDNEDEAEEAPLSPIVSKSHLNSDKSNQARKSSLGRKTTTSLFAKSSAFARTGGEDFVLGKYDSDIQNSGMIQIIEDESQELKWVNSQPSYSCTISSPRKGSKLAGLKKFITYQITCSSSGLQVSRRYKHFDWLHKQLTDKFTMLVIPPLPDKQAFGRYEEEFIDHRMKTLQSFVDRICSHPIMSESEVWKHFITCTDQKQWKHGKRKAEKDALIGGNLFLSIMVPERPIDSTDLEQKVDAFSNFTETFEASSKVMEKVAMDQAQKCQNHYKREYESIGQAFVQLGQSMKLDRSDESEKLLHAVSFTGKTYQEIAKLVDSQPKNDWVPLADTMHEYNGMLDSWSSILKVHSGARGKRKEADDAFKEGKLPESEATSIKTRTDVISYSLLTEINNFEDFRGNEIRDAHKKFLQEQISYYQKITEKLQQALSTFDNC